MSISIRANRWWVPPSYTQDQKDMHRIVLGHGWEYEESVDPSTLDRKRVYRRAGVTPCVTVEDAYIMNKALIALER